MANLLGNFLINIIASSLVMKHNLDWHRRLLLIFIPLFLLFFSFQSEYVIWRIGKLTDNKEGK